MLSLHDRRKFLGRSPFNVEVSKCTLDGDFPIHSHEYTEVTIVVGGTATHIVCGREYLVGPGDLFAVNPFYEHGFAKARDFFHYKINYTKAMLDSIGLGARSLPGFQALFVFAAAETPGGFPCRLKLSQDRLQWAVSMAKKLEEELASREPGSETLVQACFMEFAVKLARLYGKKIGQQPELGRIDKLALLASYLEKRCAEPASCKKMAKIACLSERHLRRVFELYYNASPMEHLARLRIQRAKALLNSTDKTVAEIATDCGFKESSYFCRKFKKLTGFSPRDYRRSKP